MATVETEIITLQKGEKLEHSGEYVLVSGYLACNISKHHLFFQKEGERVIYSDKYLPKGLAYVAMCKSRLVLRNSDSSPFTKKRYQFFEKELLNFMIKRIDMLTLPKKERLFLTLLKMGEEVGVIEGDRCRIPKIWSQADLAAYINCTREYLLSQKKVLKQEGFILDSHQWVLLEWESWGKRIRNNNWKKRNPTQN